MGGDAYDYAINDDGILHLAIFDGMGHGLPAAGVTAFALSAYRHSRRGGVRPAAMYAAIDAAVHDQYPTPRFVTALIAELHVASGRLRWISAGHPPPLLLRNGHLVGTLDVAPSPPLGLRLAEGEPVEGEESLQPGDMVLLYSDGLTEARRPDGELFTEERLAEFIERQAANGLPAPETLRGLREAIIERGAGSLRDDATALLDRMAPGHPIIASAPHRATEVISESSKTAVERRPPRPRGRQPFSSIRSRDEQQRLSEHWLPSNSGPGPRELASLVAW